MSHLLGIGEFKSVLEEEKVGEEVVEHSKKVLNTKYNDQVVSQVTNCYETLLLNKHETSSLSHDECKKEMINFGNDILANGKSGLG
jgi:hypothetical protein